MRQIFDEKSGEFLIVIEAALGDKQATPGINLGPVPPSNRPDLQIESTQSMGPNPLNTQCASGPASSGGGGILGINPPDFGPDMGSVPTITNALTNFACRFQVFSPSQPCTYTDASGMPKPVKGSAVVQFCDAVTSTAAFRPGDSLVTVQLRDTSGNIGPTAQIIVRVATPTPTRTPQH